MCVNTKLHIAAYWIQVLGPEFPTLIGRSEELIPHQAELIVEALEV